MDWKIPALSWTWWRPTGSSWRSVRSCTTHSLTVSGSQRISLQSRTSSYPPYQSPFSAETPHTAAFCLPVFLNINQVCQTKVVIFSNLKSIKSCFSYDSILSINQIYCALQNIL
ncbi:hypothetical protein LDENG_00295620 [Lucifuga dentata]|nr:hypothetical protein LDENG_00295620 [Lucifuga dentata]